MTSSTIVIQTSGKGMLYTVQNIALLGRIEIDFFDDFSTHSTELTIHLFAYGQVDGALATTFR